METNLAYPKRIDKAEKKSQAVPLHILIIIALCIDLFTPYGIWKHYLPSPIRWVSQAALALILLLSIFRIFVFNHIPRAFLVILGITAFWTAVALFRGQDMVTTGWGIWLLFQFPFIAVFVYLERNQPAGLDNFLRKTALVILFLQLMMQLYQYAGGQKVGDNLAGLFGKNGTADAAFFVILVNCLFLGHWIVTDRVGGLIVSLALGVAISSFGEVKLYPFFVAALGLITIVWIGILKRSIFKVVGYIILLIATVVAFLSLYNSIAPTANRHPIQAYFTDPQLLEEYLNQSNAITVHGSAAVNMGRGYQLQVGWNALKVDPVTLLFGYGIGARGESQSLGTAGIGFDATDVGLVSGSSLLVEMQEMGLVGMAVFAGFYLWILFIMARDIYRYPNSPAKGIRYAILLFSILWPVWIWYSNILHMRVPMTLYWLMIGYVLAETWQPLARSGIAEVKARYHVQHHG